MKMLRASIALWLMFIAISTQAQTQYALLIGISQYKEVTPLQFADRDAVAFAEFLKTQQVPEDNIKLFLNENATRFNIVDELYNTSLRLKKGDRFYFYFGGHGDLEARIGYENSLLLLYNSFKKSYFQGNEYLQLSELKTWFGDMTKKGVEVVFIADACHSGGLIGGKEGNTKTQKALQESWANITKILSCKADEFSLEGKQWGGGRGIFSYHLVNGLTGRADANKDNKVSLNELNNYLTTNVLREANPNIQTPVILGNNKQFLSKVSKEGLAKLADYEKRNVPIITEVNLKGGEEKATAGLISKLDTTLVYTYKQFTKAVKQRRLNTFDDSTATGYALLHYKKLTAHKIPDHIVQRIKRDLAAALIERELDIMKVTRETGGILWPKNASVLIPLAIANLDETMKLLGPTHPSYTFFQARKLALESGRAGKSISRTESADKIVQIQEENRLKSKELLLKSLQLEPNMISTYVRLSRSYQGLKPDSAIYYQEKVVELLPNQASAWLWLAYSYYGMKYKDANNQPVPHPKAIPYFEKVIELDSTIIQVYSTLGELYMLGRIYANEAPTSFHDYPKSIYYYEKALRFREIPEQELLKMGFMSLELDPNDPNYQNKYNYLISNNYYTVLCFLYKATGNLPKSEEYLKRLTRKIAVIGSADAYMQATSFMHNLCSYEETANETYLKYSLDFLQQALSKAGEDLKVASVENKPFQSLQYREILKSIGVTHRALKNYTEAENFLQQALDYQTLGSAATLPLKLRRISFFKYDKRITVPALLFKDGPLYYYYLDANVELFFLKLEQNKPDEAFAYLEKAFQTAVAEKGNGVSGEPFEKTVFETYKNLDQDRFKALKAKYFPTTEKK